MSSGWLVLRLSYAATLQARADERLREGLPQLPIITNCDNPHNWIRGIRQLRVNVQMGVAAGTQIEIVREHVEIALRKLSALAAADQSPSLRLSGSKSSATDATDTGASVSRD